MFTSTNTMEQDYCYAMEDMEKAYKRFCNTLFAGILCALSVLSIVLCFLLPFGPSTDMLIGFLLVATSFAVCFYVRYLFSLHHEWKKALRRYEEMTR